MKNLFIIASAFALCSFAVQAQVIDYGTMEEMFGEPVTVSATGKPQRISEVPVAMDIITADKIQRSGAVDIPQLLRRLPGISVTQNFFGSTDVNIRGYNQPYANRLLVLINGRQVYQDNFGMTLWNSLPIQMSEIQQIEIVRGPNTSLFGFNAASGVINIITFNPLQKTLNELEVTAGTQDYRKASGVATLALGKDAAVRLSTNSTEADGYHYGSAISKDDALDRKTGNMEWMVKINDEQSLNFEAGINHLKSDQTIPFHVAAKTDVLNKNYKLGYTHDLHDAGVINATIYRNQSNYKASAIGGIDLQLEPLGSTLDVGTLSWLFSPSTAHTLRLAAETRHNHAEGTLLGANDPGFAMDVHSLSQMWNWQINDAWSFTQAARLDHWSTARTGVITATNPFLNLAAMDKEPEGTEYSYNLGLVYAPDRVNTYRISAARGLHIPSLIELAQSIVSFPGESYGNPTLQPEINTTYSLSYSRAFSESVLTRLSTDLFVQNITHVISQTGRPIGGTGGTLADFGYENAGDSQSYGLEFALKGKILNKALCWRANYTAMLVNDDPDGMPDHYIDFKNTEPQHRVNLGLDYTRGDYDLSVDMHYVSGVNYKAVVGDSFVPYRTSSVSDYVTLNSTLGYRLTEKTLIQLTSVNLVDTHRERPSYTYTGSQGLMGSDKIGRSVFLTLRQQF